ncbi:nucleoside kinase [Bacteroidales bacterium OttesenSCG-928-B11]|nr:nucleoside kinase [Bacteroidales bacterium OttesenSCG-928-E04]MDL2311365.1 nucleoside kinase [Bacteroidales bacterium OttesenSCG-928-B11]MDL2326021.1 nucleoside kinase [Bacteroidales bacterium OttesenSCG-928-A14]
MANITVYIKDLAKVCKYPFGTSLSEIVKAEKMTSEYPFLGALVNNKVRDLNYRLHKPVAINFFDITSTHGIDMYSRSLYFILFKAVRDELPHVTLKILHSISGGKYCELEGLEGELTQDIVDRLEQRMKEITARNIPFLRDEMLTPNALAEFKKHNLYEKARLFEDRGKIFTSVYRLDDDVNYYYGVLVPSTGIVDTYKLEIYESGLLLKLPPRKSPKTLPKTRKLPKLFSVYQAYNRWVMQMGVPYISDINDRIDSGEIDDFVRITEAFHEKLIANLADKVHEKGGVKIVLLSGPSSSGKTTTCRRLSVQLGVLGYKPVQISVDDFFVERSETPRDENGDYDFETIDAVDLPLFNQTLNELLQGKEVRMPTFNFATGQKEWRGKTLQINEKSILIVEGIHCLNPKLTERIDDRYKFKIFASALISVSIDSQNPIPTSDNRLIRRIIRDYRYRNYSALDTLRRWPSVRNGEAKYIFPFQENADIMFNTSLSCELGILKQYAIPILREVPETEPEYAEASRLLKFLSFFKTIPEKSVPPGSILREFVGGSHFSY